MIFSGACLRIIRKKETIVPDSEKTILIVEDDHKTSSLVALYMEKEGFRTVIAEDGHAAIKIVDRQQPDFAENSDCPGGAVTNSTVPVHHLCTGTFASGF